MQRTAKYEERGRRPEHLVALLTSAFGRFNYHGNILKFEGCPKIRKISCRLSEGNSCARHVIIPAAKA